METANKPKQSKVKIKKKRWVRIVAPKNFGDMVLGETYVTESRSVIGRCISVNLMAITRDPKKQNMTLKFRANALSGDDVLTELIGYELSSSTIKRLVKRGKDRLDDSILVKTQDGKSVVIKPFMVTVSKTKSTIRANLRNSNTKLIAQEAARIPFDKLILDITTFKFQKGIKDMLKKIYPLKSYEIRFAEIANAREGAERKVIIAEPVPVSKEAPEEEPKEPVEEVKTQSEEPKTESTQLKEKKAKLKKKEEEKKEAAAATAKSEEDLETEVEEEIQEAKSNASQDSEEF